MDLIDILFRAYELPFLTRGLLGLLIVAVGAGLVSVFVSLRRLEFLSDGLSHAVFPGLAIGLFWGSAGVLWGAVIAAVIAAIILSVLIYNGVTSDSAIAIVLTCAFAVGVIVVSGGGNYAADLESLLFGRVLTLNTEDLVGLAGIVGVSLGLLGVTFRRQIFRAFDPSASAASGYRKLRTDLVLNITVALIVVAAASTVGALLVLAFLIIPGSAARLMTVRLVGLFPAAVIFAGLFSWLGLSLGFALSVGAGVNVPGGATVVAVFLVGYVGVLLASVLRGWLVRRRER